MSLRVRCARALLHFAMLGFAELALAAEFELPRVERVVLEDLRAAPDGAAGIEVSFRAEGPGGEAALHLRPVDLQVLQDGRVVEGLELGRFEGPVALALVLDAGRALHGAAFERTREAALALLDRLGPEDQMAVIRAGREAQVVAKPGHDRQQLAARLAEVRSEPDVERSALLDALDQALRLLRTPGLPRRRLALIVSDGASLGTEPEVLVRLVELARGGAQPRVALHTLGHARFDDAGLQGLHALAADTGGQHLVAASSLEIATGLGQLLRRGRAGYELFVPARLDGAVHELEIRVEAASDRRTLRYPRRAAARWPWIAGVGGGVLLATAAGLALLRSRRRGRLVFTRGERAGESVPLVGRCVRIGGLAENEVVIASRSVSRKHAEIRRRGRRLELVDLDSRNGTFVNGVRVSVSELRLGDAIRVGDVELVLER